MLFIFHQYHPRLVREGHLTDNLSPPSLPTSRTGDKWLTRKHPLHPPCGEKKDHRKLTVMTGCFRLGQNEEKTWLKKFSTWAIHQQPVVISASEVVGRIWPDFPPVSGHSFWSVFGVSYFNYHHHSTTWDYVRIELLSFFFVSTTWLENLRVVYIISLCLFFGFLLYLVLQSFRLQDLFK